MDTKLRDEMNNFCEEAAHKNQLEWRDIYLQLFGKVQRPGASPFDTQGNKHHQWTKEK